MSSGKCEIAQFICMLQLTNSPNHPNARQELVRRGAFDIEEDKVNFRSMLQRLMVELVKDEEQRAAQRLEAQEAEAAARREEAKRERERKKAEALERSKQRQANPDYLELRRQANAELEQKNKVRVIGEEGAGDGEVVEDEEEVKDSTPIDPFRIVNSKTRNKIFVK
ncbi:hypothetical protein EON64_03145 [archaeon]|nr:MAG: hypothetical protein EON64_03145 [archaeon]